jgi:hypothetical protein
MSNSLETIHNDILLTKIDLAEAKHNKDFTRRDRLEELLLEQQRKENYLLSKKSYLNFHYLYCHHHRHCHRHRHHQNIFHS